MGIGNKNKACNEIQNYILFYLKEVIKDVTYLLKSFTLNLD